MSRQTSMLARKVYAIVCAEFVSVTELYNLLFTEVIKLDLFYIECVCIFFFLIFFLQHVSNISQERVCL